jgi:hypothetical protein
VLERKNNQICKRKEKKIISVGEIAERKNSNKKRDERECSTVKKRKVNGIRYRIER